jgi:hypothetical protein
MEAVYYTARGNLRRLLQLYPYWRRAQFARATGMSPGWVSKWKKRLKSVSPTDEQVLHGSSRVPHHPPPRLDSQVVDRLLEIRDEPPEGRGRTPGPKAILYYLSRDEHLRQAGLRLPRSTRTIHRLLRVHGRIAPHLLNASDPIERPEPMRDFQLDAHSMPRASQLIRRANSNMWSRPSTSSIQGPPSSSRATSGPILPRKPLCRPSPLPFKHRDCPVRSPWTVTHALVGAPQGSDFPAALIRVTHSLGVAVVVCDPHHRQQNGFVERDHRTYEEECLSRHRPTTLEQVHEVTQSFGEHYNWQRPHQGLACGNRPPRVAFPALPTLLKVPDVVNADAWLPQVDGEHLVRLVNRKADGEGGCAPLLRFEHVSRTSGELTRQCRRAVLAGRVSASETQPIATQRALSAQLFL